MKTVIFFFAVLAVSCAEETGTEGHKDNCVTKWRYDIYLEKKSCLKSYMGSAIASSSVPARRKRQAAPPPVTSTVTPPSTTTVTPPSTTAVTPPSTTTSEPTPLKNCSSLDEVKEFFGEKLVKFINNSDGNKTNLANIKNGHEIRKLIFDKLLQEKRLKEFTKEDFSCIKREDIKNHTMQKCVIDALKYTANVTKIPMTISNVLSKLSHIEIEKGTCKNSVKISSCVKEVLTNCSSTVQKFVGDIDEMTMKRCEPFLRVTPPEPAKKGLSITIIVVIALVAICGSLAAGFGIFKFLKMRRNRGLHTVTRSQSEECEMTSRIK